jgi:phosphohistidine phosphatase
MKKIILVRHGRAEDQSFEFSDFERSLTAKGKIIAKFMAGKLNEKEKSLGTIITSPAFRALETSIIFAELFSIDPGSIIMNNILYFKMSFNHLPYIVSLADENNETITLFGHNPSFTEIANTLCKDGCDFMPKNGVVGISLNIKSWKEITSHCGKLEYYLKPEKLL